MKHAKEFFGVLFSVLICVFLFGIAVYATSTIGDPITVGTDLTVTSGARIGTGTNPGHITAIDDDTFYVEGDIEIDGTSYFDGNVSLSDSATLRVAVIAGHKDLGLHLQLGAAASSTHDLDAASDVIVAGELEVDGDAFFDGTSTSFSGDIKIGDGTTGHIGADTENLYVEGALEVDGTAWFDGTASMTGDIWVDRIYGTLGDGYLAIGDAGTTTHTLDVEDDLLVSGELEVDGTAFFDGNVSLSDSATLRVAVIAGHKDLGLHLQLGAAASSTHDLDTASDVIVAGELEVDGDAFFDGTSTSFSGDVKIGDGTTNRLGADTENLYVEGVVEVDGAAYFDAAASVGADLSVASAFSVTGLSTLSRASISDSLTIDTVWIHSGTASVTGTCNIGDIYFMSGTASAGKVISVCGNTDVWTWLGSAWQYY